VRRADYSSRGVLQNVVSLSVIVNPRTRGGLGTLRDVVPRTGGGLGTLRDVVPRTGRGPGTLRNVVPRTKIGASNKRLTESCRNLKTEGLCGLNSSSYIDIYKTEEDEMDRK
jgi:hypothetical protein